MNLQTAIKLFLVLVLGLPLLQVLFSWVSGLLEAMGDDSAAGALVSINTALRVGWLASIVILVVVMAMRNVQESKEE